MPPPYLPSTAPGSKCRSTSRCWYALTTSPLAPGPIDPARDRRAASRPRAGCSPGRRGRGARGDRGGRARAVDDAAARRARSRGRGVVESSRSERVADARRSRATPTTAPTVTQIHGRAKLLQRSRPSRSGGVGRRDRSDGTALRGRRDPNLTVRSRAVSFAPMRCFAFHLMPYIGLDPSYEGPAWVTVPELAVRPGGRQPALQPVPRRADLRRGAGLRRRVRQRAPPERLRQHAVAQPDRVDPRPPDVAGEDRGRRQRAAALRPADPRRRGVRHDRRDQRRPAHRRHGRRRRARVLLVLGQPDPRPGAVPRGARPDHEGVDRARARSSGSASTSASAT